MAIKAPTRIFISYHRNSNISQKIHDQLITYYGNESILSWQSAEKMPKGIDIRNYVNDQLDQCQLLLVIIDDIWIGSVFDVEESWNHPLNFTQLEVEESLRRNDLWVIPLLVDGVAMPKKDLLPKSLAGLAYRNGIVLSSEKLHEDIPRLIRELNRILDSSEKGLIAPAIRRTRRIRLGFVEPLLEVGDALPIHMVQIPGGTFLMGSPDDEPERQEREGPQHEVMVNSFFIGRYPVTQSQYEKVMGTNPASQYDVERFVAPNKPVVGVSWYDAVEFCERLAEQTGRLYRLPSEAEWEYACRAGTQTPFYFGTTLTTDVANYDGNYIYADGPKGEDRKELTSVSHFGVANAFGLCDMHGSVYEWCQDHLHSDYKGAPTDGSAWIEDGDLDQRMLRGGAWFDDPRYCRSAYRNYDMPGLSGNAVGFRVVCSAPGALQLTTS